MKAAELIKILSGHPDWDVVIRGIEFNKCGHSSEFIDLEQDDIYDEEGCFTIQGFWYK